MERLARHWRNLLEPSSPSREDASATYRCSTPSARGCRARISRRAGVHRLFEAQAGLTPDAPALLFGENALSYAELNALANRLAWRLREEGVGSDAGRYRAGRGGGGPAGGAQGRWRLCAAGSAVSRGPLMIDDSGLRLLLSQQSVLARLPQSDGLQSRCYSTTWSDWCTATRRKTRTCRRRRQSLLRDHTSVSTGQPKGVMVRHRALTNFVCSIARQPGMLARTLLSVTTFSDIFGLELYVPLARGASMLLPAASRPGSRGPLVWSSGRGSVLQATPATWRMLCDSERVDLLRGCTCCAVARRWRRTWRRVCADCRHRPESLRADRDDDLVGTVPPRRRARPFLGGRWKTPLCTSSTAK